MHADQSGFHSSPRLVSDGVERGRGRVARGRRGRCQGSAADEIEGECPRRHAARAACDLETKANMEINARKIFTMRP